jgi:hypothetical protein
LPWAASPSGVFSLLPAVFAAVLKQHQVGATMNRDRPPDFKPSSTEAPWWVGKAKRNHVLLKFIIICVVIAILILALVIAAET